MTEAQIERDRIVYYIRGQNDDVAEWVALTPFWKVLLSAIFGIGYGARLRETAITERIALEIECGKHMASSMAMEDFAKWIANEGEARED